MTEFHRRIMREVHRFAPGAKFEILRQRVHVVMKITYHDKAIQVTASVSPKNPDGAVFGAIREIRKKLNEQSQRA
jgi:hypothetical protein